ncbi:MAG: hypothetical protein AAGA44_03915 [Pseudomonadota bacterium]
MKALLKAGLIGLVLAASSAAHADRDFGIGLKAGTLGAGIEGTWRPLPYLDVRLGTNFYEYDDSGDQAGVNYNATLDLDTVYGTANLRFPLSPFRVTAGLFSNGNELNLVSDETSGTIEIGGTNYNLSDVGTVSSTSTFGSTSPYLGFGYDFTVLDRVGLIFDVGVLWQGDPEVSVTADGPIATQQAFLDSLEAERQELEDEISDFKAWPVVSLGFVVNF